MTIGKKILLYLVLILSGFIMFFPIVYAFMISFMQGGEVLQGKLIPENFTLTNYLNAFEKVPLLRYLINSLVVSTVIMLGQLLLCSLKGKTFCLCFLFPR